MSPQEVGMIEDVNKSTAESQEQSERRKGIKPTLQELENKFTEIVHELGFTNLKFSFTSEENRKAKAKIFVDESFWKAPNEIRTEEGLEPFPEEEYNRPMKQGGQAQAQQETEEK